MRKPVCESLDTGMSEGSHRHDCHNFLFQSLTECNYSVFRI